jgi:hypothetical protein
MWRWSIVRRFTGVPLLAGTWRGIIESSFTKPDGTRVAPIPAALRITQNASALTVTLFTGESSSKSSSVQLMRLDDERWRLNWLYENVPRLAVRDRHDRHCGAAELFLGGRDGEEMSGEYFTDRLTQGELHFTEWSPQYYGNAASALKSADFIQPQPFATPGQRRGPESANGVVADAL